ncbi:MAG: CBS domain-containing protein [Candidatus Dadabacteria bacterium]|nr:MAG: CBS domain-containing protein [Candidatus Dadabacteria bacterium]
MSIPFEDFLSENEDEYDRWLHQAESRFDDDLYEARIADAPFADPWLIPAEATVADAVKMMQKVRNGYLLVGDLSDLQGVLSERDILHKALASGRALDDLRVRDLMTANPETIGLQDRIVTAIRKMAEGRFRRLPIIDATGTVCGVLSVRNVLRYLSEYFQDEILNAPPEGTRIRPDLYSG